MKLIRLNFQNYTKKMGAKKITIAIDGFSSCGKSTLAKALAKELDYIFIDTGAMYRSVALFCLRNDLVHNNEIIINDIVKALSKIDIHFAKNPTTEKLEVQLNHEFVEPYIRSLEVSNLVSKIAAIKEVRAKLVQEQQKMGLKGGVVMDGRDIGSVVFPDAELKLFVTASPEIRINRRYLELSKNEPDISKDEIRKNLEERDFLDSTREESPLVQADDAILIDNSNYTQAEQLEVALNYVRERI
jgi:cytidylate kinase